MRILLVFLLLNSAVAYAECEMEAEALNRYEHQILQAAETGKLKDMAEPLACILQMQNESEGMARVLANSYLGPLLGGGQISGLKIDPRYKVVAQAIERLSMRAPDALQRSFVSEFSKGDWRFYTLFCEQGDVAYCSAFLPDEKKVQAEPPLVAAASLMRLRKAYKVLDGKQRELVEARLKKLYREIPKQDQLKRKFIDEIYRELFSLEMPLSLLT